MKTGIAGTLVLPLAVLILFMPGCISIQEYWTIPDDQPPVAGIPAEETPSSGPVDQDFARENARGQEEARPQREEADRRETEARENARGQEEARPRREEADRREAEARENARRQEEARLQREEADRREAGARENIRRQEEARLQREEADRREAEARENARRQEEVRQLLENLETTHRQAEAKEAARQENESRRFSGGQTGTDIKPRYYVVRPGDTFNSIAADPQIYNNRNEWFAIYQANRDKLEDPDNPHLLTPGTVIEIPSITGETREGTY
ncbi:MAG: LysM peptidoglycan-binding domain-containing protein [Treponema sp.]|nr:LysM peptidoglycan-binding domain-containing protein [Treponema sp.]